jgi:serine/threonine protein kinase
LEYQETIEFPSLCFTDPALNTAAIGDRTPFGLPLPITGQFTNVYRMVQRNGEMVAVRLFLRDNPERTAHWQAIQTYLQSLPHLPPCLAPVDFQQDGFFLKGRHYPLVKMPWLHGVLLNAYIEKYLYDSSALTRLVQNWCDVIAALESIRFVHGDLQHGNILVAEESGAISLIDYDASYVPTLARATNRETGHPSYQHPKRSPADYGPFLDHFSVFAIYVALRTLVVVPDLWYRLDNGDNILFQREDFEEPRNSRAFAILQDALRTSPTERALVLRLRALCEASPRDVPPLSHNL